MYLPVVEAADVCLALVYCAVDCGLGSVPGTFDQHYQWCGYDPLPQG